MSKKKFEKSKLCPKLCPKCGSEMTELRSEKEAAYYQVLVDSGGDYFDAEEMSRGLDTRRRLVCKCGHEEKK